MPMRICMLGTEYVDDHIIYKIGVEEDGVEWTVQKRYRDFLPLDEKLKHLPERHYLPPRGLVGFRRKFRATDFMKRRQEGLEKYLNKQLEQLASEKEGESFTEERDALARFLSPADQSCIRTGRSTWVATRDRQTVMVVRAENSVEVDVDCADSIGLLGYEVFMGNLPTGNSGVFSIACLLGPLDDASVDELSSALQRIVTACPYLAGRVREHTIALCNRGVPFTVERKDGPCPENISHEEVLDLCDVRSPSKIMAGKEPLITVKVSCHDDGAVLGVAASHCMMDGSSLFGLLNSWGRLCRGKPHGLREGFEGATRAPLRRALKEDLIRCPHAASAKFGSFLHRVDDTSGKLFDKAGAFFGRGVASAALKAVVAVVPRMLGEAANRVCLYIPKDKVNALKTAATPPADAGGDGWVSTQEAVVAHLLLSLWKAFMTGVALKHGGCASVAFFVDMRKMLGVADNYFFGTGFQVVEFYVKDMQTKSLAECAADIHEESRNLGQKASQKWHLWHHAFQDKVRFEHFVNDMVTSQGSDMTLTVNNNSKRELPNFGNAGGVVKGMMSSMGPTLLLARGGGLEIILAHDLYVAASDDKRREFLNIFHQFVHQLP
eukprot:TRINITY_DN19241_c0_g1_i1.p1 TRINITY_DN19241_c0_g1~~TRINITY_DN19241_c0_g1_i1.p1  ORF type:complete len:607 (-),score=88.50 TRINITY_DN19241_c0_g1_i1:246-2066(-)